jgi:hypothetical protein
MVVMVNFWVALVVVMVVVVVSALFAAAQGETSVGLAWRSAGVLGVLQ